MENKTLKFSVFHLSIDDRQFVLSDFDAIQENDTEQDTISNSNSQEVVSLKIKQKSIKNQRFILIYSNEGDKFPYSKEVYDTSGNNITAKDNPRKAEEIELNIQFFVLIDVQDQRLFLSDGRKKVSFHDWLIEKIKKKISIKSIIQEKQFIERMKTVNKISFTVSPTLFSSSKQDILSSNIVRDIHGFGADSAKIELNYKSTSINDKIVSQLKKLIGMKDEFDEMTVVGRNENDFESIFNLEEIASKVYVSVPTDEKSKQINPDSVFNALISKITSHENI